MKKIRILSTGIIIICLAINFQGLSQIDFKKVTLKRNRIGITDTFNLSKEPAENNRVYITLLGMVKSDNREIKILAWKRIWGPNMHSTGIIYLYDKSNKYIGKYEFGDGLDLPIALEQNNLVFSNKDRSGCDNALITKIDFRQRVPETIFITCNGDGGDLYSFSEKK